jgi:hypothetical protein
MAGSSLRCHEELDRKKIRHPWGDVPTTGWSRLNSLGRPHFSNVLSAHPSHVPISSWVNQKYPSSPTSPSERRDVDLLGLVVKGLRTINRPISFVFRATAVRVQLRLQFRHPPREVLDAS